MEVCSHRKGYTAAAGTLRFASDPALEPMCCLVKGRYVGLDVEIMKRIAYELNMKIEFIPMNFGALIEVVLAGKADAVGGAMSITEARKEKTDFPECHYDGGLSILAKHNGAYRGPDAIRSVADLSGRRVGTRTNGALKRLADRFVSGVAYHYCNDHANSVQALRTEKIDAVLLDDPVGRCFVSKFPDELQIADVFIDEHYGFALKKGSPLTAEVAKIIRGMRETNMLNFELVKADFDLYHFRRVEIFCSRVRSRWPWKSEFPKRRKPPKLLRRGGATGTIRWKRSTNRAKCRE